MKKTLKNTASLIWFDIPADDPSRAKQFYGKLFGWKITPFPGTTASEATNYQHIDTGGPEVSPDGGLLKRMHADHTITTYFSVPSVTMYVAKIKKLGGNVCKSKTVVPGMGYFAICTDTEGNTFAIWEMNSKAK